MADDSNNTPGPAYTSEEVSGEFVSPNIFNIRYSNTSAGPTPTPSAPPESEPEK